MAKHEELIKQIEEMSVLELSGFVKELEEKFGVSAAAFAAPAAAAPAEGGAEAEEKDAFDIVLKAIGDQKIQVIKVVREVTGLGLKEAKDMVDKAPGTIKEAVKKEEAEEIKKKIEAAGGVAELR